MKRKPPSFVDMTGFVSYNSLVNVAGKLRKFIGWKGESNGREEEPFDR